jgi:3-(3-hydroxy-phenyl)propionate hydroxylase
MTPKSQMERFFRAAALDLAAKHAFARRFVNSGRLSAPCSLAGLSLQGDWDGDGLKPGLACPDAPIEDAGQPGFLLGYLGGAFKLLALGAVDAPADGKLPVVRVGAGGLGDPAGLVAARFGWNRLYLIRSDQHVAASFAAPTPEAVRRALRRAKGATERRSAAAA